MGFGLSSLRQDLGAELGRWAQQAQVRILLLDPRVPIPEYTYAEQRDMEEGNAKGAITNDIRMFIEELERTVGLGDPRLEVRLYSTLPAINVFRIDSEAFWGPYIVGKQSRNTTTFLVNDTGFMFEEVMTHFENIWNTADFSSPASEYLATLAKGEDSGSESQAEG